MRSSAIDTSIERRCKTSSAPDREAVVVFADGCGPAFLRALRPGFRHCFVAVASQDQWVLCDPLLHRTDLVAFEASSAADIVRLYEDLGLVALRTRIRPDPVFCVRVRPFTCVEVVKRVLGIDAPFIITPWQLFREISTE